MFDMFGCNGEWNLFLRMSIACTHTCRRKCSKVPKRQEIESRRGNRQQRFASHLRMPQKIAHLYDLVIRTRFGAWLFIDWNCRTIQIDCAPLANSMQFCPKKFSSLHKFGKMRFLVLGFDSNGENITIKRNICIITMDNLVCLLPDRQITKITDISSFVFFISNIICHKFYAFHICSSSLWYLIQLELSNSKHESIVNLYGNILWNIHQTAPIFIK